MRLLPGDLICVVRAGLGAVPENQPAFTGCDGVTLEFRVFQTRIPAGSSF